MLRFDMYIYACSFSSYNHLSYKISIRFSLKMYFLFNKDFIDLFSDAADTFLSYHKFIM